ncbi:RluA family pseudouridine synthase [Lachnospiraceae bacterium 2_1_46FAA]|nr:RluA family pseudouridine synthase [Lachnospiraceae bacterium 2_1_46FAA]
MQEIQIAANEAGQRLDKLLAKYLSEAPKSFLYKMLRKKNIVLNGKKASGNEKLVAGDSVKLFLSDETIQKFSKEITVCKSNTKLDILYEDDDILLVNKPAGMLSQKAEAKDISLVEHLISYLLESGQLTRENLKSFKPSICNRLDRNTSGLVVCGKSLKGLQTMGQLFKERKLKKYYRCIVAGNVTEKQYVKGYLIKDEKKNQVTVSDTYFPESQEIETEYRPIQQLKQGTLLEVHLITGKTHQIRAHLASQGHAVIGDYKYGSREINDRYKKEYQLSHQLLHAYRLEVPKTKELPQLSEKMFVAPLPKQFQKIIEGESR